jgi:uncharacterized damage-inducible protein DinB
MAYWPWFERVFVFDFPVGKFPDILERLRGTPARLEERVRGLDASVLQEREGDRWSIQENAGHLYDLEPLWRTRFDDFLSGVAELTAADISNKKTHGADHHKRSIDETLGIFRDVRAETMALLDGLSAEDFARTANHPRLNIPMRLVDLCMFVADHDDYHLARISSLVRAFL